MQTSSMYRLSCTHARVLDLYDHYTHRNFATGSSKCLYSRLDRSISESVACSRAVLYQSHVLYCYCYWLLLVLSTKQLAVRHVLEPALQQSIIEFGI